MQDPGNSGITSHHPLAGCAIVALDVEVREGVVVELGLAGPQRVLCYRGEGEIRRALERLQERAPLVVGHNLKKWDLPALARQFEGLGPWRFPIVDTLDWQARLSPWRRNLALAGSHRADGDAARTLELFARQLGVLARAGVWVGNPGEDTGALLAAEAVTGAESWGMYHGLEDFLPELRTLPLAGLDHRELSGLRDPEDCLEPEGLHPWLDRVERAVETWRTARDTSPDALPASGGDRALLVVMPPFLLGGFAARGRRLVLGRSGNVCLRESRLAWRFWSMGHGLSVQGNHPQAQPFRSLDTNCMTCPERGCPAHPGSMDLWGVSWQELDDPDVIHFLEDHPPAKVIHTGSEVAIDWSWRELAHFRQDQLAEAGLLAASFSLGSGPRSRLRITEQNARSLLAAAGRKGWTHLAWPYLKTTVPEGPSAIPGSMAAIGEPDADESRTLGGNRGIRRISEALLERAWFLERHGAERISLASVLSQPAELASALGRGAPQDMDGLVDHSRPPVPTVLCPVAERSPAGDGRLRPVPLAPGTPLRAAYWSRVLSHLLPMVGENSVLLAIRLLEEVEPIHRVLSDVCSPIRLVREDDLGSVVRQLRRKPGSLAVIPLARVDELAGLEPSGISLVLECIDPAGIPVIRNPGSPWSGNTESSLDLAGLQQEAPEQDTWNGSGDETPIPTGWRRRGNVLWFRRLGRQLADYGTAGGGEIWMLDPLLSMATPADVRVERRVTHHPAPAEQLHSALQREFPEPAALSPEVPEGWRETLEHTFLAGRGENGGPGRFRDEQVVYLDKVFKGEHDQIVSLPTGGGKSLVFQGPALLMGSLTGRLTVVVAPLRALMTDQVAGLMKLGVVGVVEAITGDMDPFEMQDVYRRLAGGEVWMVYVSPERFRSPGFLKALDARLKRDGGAQYWVFDEAHCISQWGLDFRPDYWSAARAVAGIRQEGTRPSPVLLLSATLSDQAMDDLATIFRREPA